MVIMGLLGYQSRTGFLAGLTVAQISEFSLIFIAMGITIGHLQSDALGLVTLVGLITIAVSVYMISFSHSLYEKLSDHIKVFEFSFSKPKSNHQKVTINSPEIIVCGVGRFGTAIAEQLLFHNRTFSVIDCNPDKFTLWRKKGVDCLFGDIGDIEFLSHIQLHKCRWFIVTLPRDALGHRFEDPRKQLLQNLKALNFSGKLAMASETESDYDVLKNMGVDVILTPYEDAAHNATNTILEQ